MHPDREKTATGTEAQAGDPAAVLRRLVRHARQLVEADDALPEPAVLRLSNEILAAVEKVTATGAVTEEVLSAPDILLSLGTLCRDRPG